MKIYEKTEAAISLHGLGFIQVQLGAEQRLHVWHPGLPRRRCWEASSIHDHRFGFDSLVLVGRQINRTYAFEPCLDEAQQTHIGYLHEGPRTAFGNRPWVPHLRLRQSMIVSREEVVAGQTYHMLPYVYHSTEPGGDGRVATLMRKTSEASEGAHSLCLKNVEPDADFNRFQLAPSQLWPFVEDVLGAAAMLEAA